MKAVSKLGWTAYAVALVTILLDQAVKHWIMEILRLPDRLTVPVAGPFHLSFVQNFGVSFGLLQAEADLARWGLTLFSLVVAVILAHWARQPERLVAALGLGLIIGGAVGNAIDRGRLGYVIDYLDFQRLGFFPWVFNLADSAITVGVVLLLADTLRREPAA